MSSGNGSVGRGLTRSEHVPIMQSVYFYALEI
jgi:hypothetical protein